MVEAPSSLDTSASAAGPGARVRALIKLGKSDQLARSSIAVMSTTVGNSALGYVFWVLSARNFTASDVGATAAIVSLATIAATLSDLGLRTALMQKLPNERGQAEWSRRVTSALLTGLTSSFVLGVAAALVAPVLSEQMRRYIDPTVVVCIVLLTMSTTIFTMLDGVSMSEHRAGQIPIRGATMGTVKVLVLGVAVGATLHHSKLILVATVAGTAAAAGWGVFRQIRIARPDFKFRVQGAFAGMRGMRNTLVGHHLVNLGGFLPAFVLPLEVVARESTEQNAYMTVTWLLGSAFFTVSPAVSSALFVQGRWNPDVLRATTRRAAKLIAVLLVPVALVVILVGHFVLGLFGSNYAHYGYPLLLVLLISSLPDAVTNIRIGRLRAEARLAPAARMNLGMALVSIVLAWFLIPHIGIVGVGVAWLSAQTAGSIWGFIEDRIAVSEPGAHADSTGSGDAIRAADLVEREQSALYLFGSARPGVIPPAPGDEDADRGRLG